MICQTTQKAQDAFWASVKNQPQSARQKKGRRLVAEPDTGLIAGTRWDCWTDDGTTEKPRHGWDDLRSITIAYALLAQWADELGIPGIEPAILRGTEQNNFEAWYLSRGQHNEGYANIFRIATDKIIEAGYSVYISDACLKIYRAEDLA